MTDETERCLEIVRAAMMETHLTPYRALRRVFYAILEQEDDPEWK